MEGNATSTLPASRLTVCPSSSYGGDLSSITQHQRVAYAAPAFALAFVGVPVYIFLPKFYTDVVGVNIATVGWILLAARLFDAVTDPGVGILSDRTNTRWGRRRPYILGASLPLAVSIYFLLVPPEGSGAVWFSIWLFAIFVFWTVLVVPYESLGPELSFDYHQRTGILAARDGTLVAGTVVAAAAPVIVSQLLDLPETSAGEREKFFWIALIYSPLVVLLSAWCVAVVPERPRPPLDAAHHGLREGLALVMRNRPFRVLLAGYTLGTLAFNLAGTLLLYYVRYVLGSSRAELFLVIYLVSGVVCLPLWIVLSQRWEKRKTWIAGMATYAAGGAGILFLGEGDGDIYAFLCFVTGMTFGSTVAVPSSMQADTIDADELDSGERREGLYVGIWSITRKLAAALGVGVALPLLETAGYQPNVAQTPATRWALRILYAGVPLVCNLAAIVIAWRYPIDRERHEAIRAAIERRSSSTT